MSWFLLVIISTIAFSISRILQKSLIEDKESNPIAFAFILGVFVSIVIFIWALIDGLNFPNLTKYIPNLIAMCLLYSLGNLFIFKAFKVAEASEVIILMASSTIWSIITSGILLNEQIGPAKLLATFLIFLGVATVYYSKSKFNPNLGHLFALLSAIFIGVAFVNDAYMIGKFKNNSSYIFISFLFPSLTILLLQPTAIKQVKQFLNKKLIPKLVISSILFGISTSFIFLAYKKGGEASVIYPISQVGVLITVFISYFFLKERDRLWHKIIGALLVLAGVWLLR